MPWFMPLMASSLEQCMNSNQIRDVRKPLCLSVQRIEPAETIMQLAEELAGAISWLKSRGIVHGSLRPANVLLDN
ncbi:hypothetical protein MY11210_000131 [Beauveria gryllotalpidicola]